MTWSSTPSRPSNSSPSSRWPRSPPISVQTPRRRSQAPISLSTAAGPRNRARMTKKGEAASRKTINLALQGGGAHGAYTWGVLDALLEDGRIAFDAISGASAGAMNAVAFAEGFIDKGPDGARQKLHDFWLSVSQEGALTPVQRKLFDVWFGGFAFSASPAYYWYDAVTTFASPYEFNPLDINPLRDHLVRTIDFEKIRASNQVKLLIAATNVFTGKGAIFRRHELTAEHVMASACLPRFFQAVQINGIPYWDGG